MHLRKLCEFGLILALAVAVVVGGCALDDTEADPPVEIVVEALDWQDDSPQAGVTVAVMAPETNRIIAGPTATGADGRAVLTVERGRVGLVAFPGDGRGLFHLPPPLDLDGDVELRLLTRRDDAFLDEAPRLAGVVVDRDNGEPLGGVFLHHGMRWSSYLSAWRGLYQPGDDLTLEDGRFSCPGAVFAQNPNTGTVIHLAPLVLTREGYEPKIYLHHFRPGEVETDLSGLELRMRRLDGEASASLVGRVTCLGRPIEAVAVGLSPLWSVGKGGVGQPALIALTDTAGVFRFAGVDAGTWQLHPSYLPDDGYSFVEAVPPVDLADGEQTDAGDVTVLHSVTPVHPAPGATATSVDHLRWRAVAEADSYLVRLDGIVFAATADTALTLPAAPPLAEGWHGWWIEARTKDDVTLGVVETEAVFRIRADATGRADRP